MLADWNQALRETKAAAGRAARVLRVGFMSSAANEATQQIIAAFGQLRPVLASRNAAGRHVRPHRRTGQRRR
jgi:DNA-binding transcriptional LysR family regulator